jgi:hypothetical protein
MGFESLLSSAGIAIFCMLLTYYMWIKAVKTGSIYWAAKCALAYFYMVTLCVCVCVCVCVCTYVCIYMSLCPFLFSGARI